MKTKIKYLSSLVFILLSLSGCSDGSLEIVGKVHVFESNGFKCWYIVDEVNGGQYELVSSDQFMLKEGRKVKLNARASKDETVCKVGDRIEVISYKVMN